jgi:cysteine synthase A
MAQKLAHVGLAVGISSGANLIGALKVQDEIGADTIVVTTFSDSNKKYLSTDLMRSEPEEAGYLSPDVQILGFGSLKRVCALCCDDPDCSEHAKRRDHSMDAVAAE